MSLGSVDANEAITVCLTQPGSDGKASLYEFHPKFTYPIFGEAEQIFGYKDLKIDIKFSAYEHKPHIQVRAGKKFVPVGSTKALDIESTLQDFLPPSAFEKTYDDIQQHEEGSKDWTPPGKLVQQYTRSGKEYEIWAGSLLDPVVRRLLDNVQILILFFIEGGQFINLDDVDWTLDRWRVYFVYEKAADRPNPFTTPYCLVGYATTYRFYKFSVPKSRSATTALEFYPPPDEIKPTQLSSRLRISQFLILPPFQRGGHGSALYQAVYSEVIADPTITEMTVEDPSEEFDKLRDVNDWKVLEPAFRAANVRINNRPFPSNTRIKRVPTSRLLPLDTLRTIRMANKIASRQFARQVEMYLLSLVPFSHRANGGANMSKIIVQKSKASNADDRCYYWWRVLLKQRIIKKNKDLLSQLPLEERFPQIDDSARAQEDEYEGLLAAIVDKVLSGNGDANGSSLEPGPSPAAPRKRKIIEDDDEDDDDDGGIVAAKRPKA